VRILAAASLIEPEMRCRMLDSIGGQIRKSRARRGHQLLVAAIAFNFLAPLLNP